MTEKINLGGERSVIRYALSAKFIIFFATGRYDLKVVSNHLLGFTNVYKLAKTTDKNARKIKKNTRTFDQRGTPYSAKLCALITYTLKTIWLRPAEEAINERNQAIIQVKVRI